MRLEIFESLSCIDLLIYNFKENIPVVREHLSALRMYIEFADVYRVCGCISNFADVYRVCGCITDKYR